VVALRRRRPPQRPGAKSPALVGASEDRLRSPKATVSGGRNYGLRGLGVG